MKSAAHLFVCPSPSLQKIGSRPFLEAHAASDQPEVIKAGDEVCWTHKAFNGWCLEDCWERFPDLRSERFSLTYLAQTLFSN